MNVKGDAGSQRLQLGKPLTSGLGRFPIVRRHLKQGMDVLLTLQCDDILHMANFDLAEAVIGRFLYLVGVGTVIQHFL